MHKKKSGLSRRQILGTAAASAFSFSFFPRHVIAGSGQTPPSEKVRVAGIGAGGMGGGDIGTVSRLGAEIVALCDVDEERAAGLFNAFPKASRYKDFRIMLEKEEKNIDAVTVGTPDHIHAVASMMAIKMGKHVYCQKPLTHTLFECRELTKAAAKAKVMTSMGNQGHATEGARRTNEIIQSGLLGEVREVHVWSDRAGHLWKQGIERPKESVKIPSTLDWDLWLGPIAERPYHPTYCPVWWRGWWDFGTGALGDMGCHIIDHPVWALELGPPSQIEARTTLDGTVLADNKRNLETYPIASIIHFDFPERGTRPPVHMIWYDGGLMPPTPPEMPEGEKLPDNGVLYIGSRGKMYHSSHGGNPNLLPIELNDSKESIPFTMKRSPGHYEEWIEACQGGPEPVASFGYSGPMTETILLGVLALRAPGRRLAWDSQNLKVTNAPELNQFTHVEYRKGWTLT